MVQKIIKYPGAGVILLMLIIVPACSRETGNAPRYSEWSRGPSSEPSFFPIAVWMQDPINAFRYKSAGINTYVALWQGPTEEQLSLLGKAGMNLICAQNDTAVRHMDNPAIIGWMHMDEPDNAQPKKNGAGYDPPVPPEAVMADYKRIRYIDSTRPVFLNLGQGVAWDGWYGRGVRTNRPQDYPRYLKACDIASFDIYPATITHPEIKDQLWYVSHGVQRLVKWAGGKKIIWNCVECTHIDNPKKKATPHQVRSEVWMSIIHGSRGIIYFVHQFKPVFIEAALLADPETLRAVTVINRQIKELAPALNSSDVVTTVEVRTGAPDVPVAYVAKRHNGFLYLFSAGMRNGTTGASFTIQNIETENTAEVLGEGRTVPVSNGDFSDQFAPWDVHLYKIRLVSRR